MKCRDFAAWMLAGLFVCGLACGCKSTLDSSVDIKGIFGPAGREAQRNAELARQGSSLPPIEGKEELDAAKRLYDAKQYPQAASAFKKIYKTKKFKDKPAEEEALFYYAECQYQMKKFPKAQDGYDELLKKYPSSRYLEQCTKHLYAIALYWLQMPKPAAEVELAQFTREQPAPNEPGKETPDTVRLSPIPNLVDSTRPVFDTPGRALEALRKVWISDPTGPLADDALMTAATHHMRKGDNREADNLFAIIRQQYGNGDHAPAAYVLGSHVSLASYQGSNYDGQQLENARKLTESANKLFPDLPQQRYLRTNLTRMQEEAARRQWTRAEYHLKRREKDSAAYYCELILTQHPDSKIAKEARETLIKLGPEHAAGLLKQPLFEKTPAESVPAYEDAPSGDEPPQEPGRLRLSDLEDDRAAPLDE
jgi:outer membrane protein assembly factor BamD (BamD/ComL family)